MRYLAFSPPSSRHRGVQEAPRVTRLVSGGARFGAQGHGSLTYACGGGPTHKASPVYVFLMKQTEVQYHQAIVSAPGDRHPCGTSHLEGPHCRIESMLSTLPRKYTGNLSMSGLVTHPGRRQQFQNTALKSKPHPSSPRQSQETWLQWQGDGPGKGRVAEEKRRGSKEQGLFTSFNLIKGQRR